MLPADLFIAHTHRAWFDNLSALGERTVSGSVVVDEVNFWSPKSPKPIKKFRVGEPIFFRLGGGERKVAGYGFYAQHLDSIDANLAWDLFGAKNGARSRAEFASILGRDLPALTDKLGSMILRQATFWPDYRWIPWGEERDYARSGIQRGRTDDNPANIAALMAALQRDARPEAPPDLAPRFRLLELDQRRFDPALVARREGQGTFRARLLTAYGQCAVTDEHTEPVLDAAHIQPYLGPASNHIQNGLLLTKEFHVLFDRGLVCVQDRGGEYLLRVSDQLQERWNNGRRYRTYDGHRLHVPGDPALRPSVEALAWHRENVFERVA